MKLFQKLWFKILCAVGVFFALAASIVAVVVLAPYKKIADSFELAELAGDTRATIVYGANGSVVGTLFAEDRRPVGRDALPQHLVDALVATEDGRFFSHGGWDPKGIIRAAVSNFKEGGISEGASTLTQQLARNAYEIQETRYARKAVEIFLARRIEGHCSKDEILVYYLNEIYFGNGYYGIEAAAQGYFGKPTLRLSLTEAATLVGLIKRPNAYNPFIDPVTSKKVRDHTLRRMSVEGSLSKLELEAAVSEPVAPLPESQRTNGGISALSEIESDVERALGRRPTASDGLRVHTSIDTVLQSALAAALREHIGGYKNDAAPGKELQAAAVVLDNSTAEVVAAVGSQQGGAGGFDRAFRAHRPPGTAFTPFVYAAAIEAGISPYAPVLDTPLDNNKVMIGGLQGILGEWGAENREANYLGEISARDAIVKSKNSATVRLGFLVGEKKVIELARRAGISSPLTPSPPLFLGQSDVTPAELALAYSTIPNSGYRAGNFSVLRKIEDYNGNLLYERVPPAGHPVMAPETAAHVHSALAGALEEGTAKDSITELGFQHMPSGGKTGTSYRLGDAWFVGYNSRLTCAVWSGFDIPQRIGEAGFGHVLALPVWVDAMNASTEHFPPGEISPPEGTSPVFLCNRSGQRPTDACVEKGPRGSVAAIHRAYLTPSEIAVLHDCPVHQDSLPAEPVGRPRGGYPLTRQPVIPAGPALAGKDPFAAAN